MKQIKGAVAITWGGLGLTVVGMLATFVAGADGMRQVMAGLLLPPVGLTAVGVFLLYRGIRTEVEALSRRIDRLERRLYP